ncbi:MAG: hypothetical protein JZU65_06165 [Chlorobium sp.]|nr:hypothetical protein [Chlorobium sp.]
MIKSAARLGIWNGKERSQYFESCRWLLERYPATVVFTKEVGYHSGGWWKNPDYERCWHLSLSFRGGAEKKVTAEIINNIFGLYKNLLWVEPPHSEQGKKLNVWHYRLFCDDNWNPIKPRGEVYSTQFTELGWRSFSGLHNEK